MISPIMHFFVWAFPLWRSVFSPIHVITRQIGRAVCCNLYRLLRRNKGFPRPSLTREELMVVAEELMVVVCRLMDYFLPTS